MNSQFFSYSQDASRLRISWGSSTNFKSHMSSNFEWTKAHDEKKKKIGKGINHQKEFFIRLC
jgi:hypothetical protein